MAQQRLGADDGLALYSTSDVLAVGWLANHVRERMHGDVTYFNVNRHINPPTSALRPASSAPSAAKKATPPATPWRLMRRGKPPPPAILKPSPSSISSAACTPIYRLSSSSIYPRPQRAFPKVHIKAFTMVEIAFLARRAKLSIEETLLKLRDAGVDSMPGGGAEIFAARVRSIICDHKIDGEEWLETARTAHKLGFKSNATMLYGHIENDADRVDHLLKLRALQDETGGFQTSFRSRSILKTPCSITCPSPQDSPTFARSRQPPAARQLPAHQGLLANDDAQDRANCAALRRR